jgi:hypothetical protein
MELYDDLLEKVDIKTDRSLSMEGNNENATNK